MATKNPPVVGQAINPTGIRPADYIDGSSAIRVTAGEDIPANAIVYIDGADRNRARVKLAKAVTASLATLRRALYIAPFAMKSGEVGFVVNRGSFFGINTTGLSVGSPVILSKDGTVIRQADLTTETTIVTLGTVIYVGDANSSQPTVWLDTSQSSPNPYSFPFALHGGPADSSMDGFGHRIHCLTVEYESTDINITMPFAGRVVDAKIWKNGAGGAGAAVTLENNAAATIFSWSLDPSSNGAVYQPTAVGIANVGFSAGHNLKVNVGGVDPNGTLQIFVIYSPV